MTIVKRCNKCGENKPLDSFPIRNDRPSGRQSRCKDCGNEYNRTHKAEYKAWCDSNRDHINEYARSYNHKTGRCLPIGENKESSSYLGVYIAERVLARYFDYIERMPACNPGFDFICSKGFKIDVKCSCLIERTYFGKYTYTSWRFNIGRNTVADYFLLLGMDNRDSLTPLKIWLIPGDDINSLSGIGITNSIKGVSKWVKYERPIDRVMVCCDEIRGIND
jgi:hypothetical protein